MFHSGILPLVATTSIFLSINTLLTFIASCSKPPGLPRRSITSARRCSPTRRSNTPASQAWLDQQERDILVRALRESGFNRTATAARLGISLRQIRYRIARLNIAVPNDQDFLDEIG